MWVDSELGQGACFTIYLPRVKRAIAPDMSAKAEARPRGTETILVAEDEEALREAICDYLRSLGYTVFAASSGQQALSVASQHEGHIDLLITDLVMPKMSGRELAQTLGSLRPDLKTIYMSGYTDDAVLRHGIHESRVRPSCKSRSAWARLRAKCATRSDGPKQCNSTAQPRRQPGGYWLRILKDGSYRGACPYSPDLRTEEARALAGSGSAHSPTMVLYSDSNCLDTWMIPSQTKRS